MSNMIKVSIIMPSLNVEQYIDECIQSVIKQTLADIEIICVDAGSTDGTWEKLEEYEGNDSRIVLLKSDIKSYGYQVNLGIRCAKGKYIGIVETDDYIESSMYERLWECAKNTGYPDYVKGEISEFVDIDNGRVSWIRHHPARIYDEQLDLKSHREVVFADYGTVWDGIVKRDFLRTKSILFNESKGAAYQDTSFLLMLALRAEMGAYIKGGYYNYRNDNNASSVKQQKLWFALIDEFDYLDKCLTTEEKTDVRKREYYLEQKIACYYWNYTRLTEDSYREGFVDKVMPQLRGIKESDSWMRLPDDYKEQVERILNDNYDSVKKEDNVQQDSIKMILKDAEKIIVVSAGQYCDRLIFLQKLLGRRMIEGICDNSSNLIGKYKENYLINSVEEMLNCYRGNLSIKWLIANRKHYEDIKNQLIDLGIEENRIMPEVMIPIQSKMLNLLVSENCSGKV